MYFASNINKDYLLFIGIYTFLQVWSKKNTVIIEILPILFIYLTANIKSSKMKQFFYRFAMLLIILAVFQSCNKPEMEGPSGDDLMLKSADGKISYIVVLKDAELNNELASLKGYEKEQATVKKATEKILSRAGISDGEVSYVYGTAITGFSVMIPPGQLKKLELDPSVEYIKEDQVVSLIQPDTRILKRPSSPPPPSGETIPWGIQRVNGPGNGAGKTAWIIDTGIDLDHPDLNVDVENSANFVPRETSPEDMNGHGTHVAGIIAAINNEMGVIGVAAGAKVVAVRVLNRQGSGAYSTIMAGVDYAAANASPGDVANMSLGGGYYEPMNAAVEKAAATGLKFAIAAGNEGVEASKKSPASATGLNIYTISAMDKNDVFASWSNYGNPPVDYCEPGVSIYSCYKNGGYATLNNTSIAAPHAAGILLLGNIRTVSTVKNDKDNNADKIGVIN